MKWHDVETQIINDGQRFSDRVKNLAPQNSKYVGRDNGRLVDYIYVEGQRVRSNSNTLYNNISYVQQGISGKELVLKTVVNSGAVPYYDEAVMQPNRTVAIHYGRQEYGSKRYSNSVELVKENRNYLYYMRGSVFMEELINKYNGKTVIVDESMEAFE